MTRVLLPILVGMAGGYLYHRLTLPLTGGSCPLTCSPWRAMALGGLIGLLWPLGGGRGTMAGTDVTEVLNLKETETMAQSNVVDGIPVHVSDRSFESFIGQTDKPVLLDAYADWCAPCRRLAPELEQVAKDLSGQVVVAKVDVDANPGLSQALQIRGIPALFVIKDGQVVDNWTGLMPAADIVAKLQPHLDQN